jgi:hypothetical protein
MPTEIRSQHQRTASPLPWALTSGITGLVADMLLVVDQLPENVGHVHQNFMWLPDAIAGVMLVQFLTFIPVALALPRWLPQRRSVRLATAGAIGAMVAVAILQLLLIVGVVQFDVQVVVVMAMFLLVSTWMITVSSTGHRYGTMPRWVTRFGLLLGAAYPAGLVIAGSGLLFPTGSAAQLAFVVPGIAVVAFGWLSLPVWPLILARRVFSKPPLHSP